MESEEEFSATCSSPKSLPSSISTGVPVVLKLTAWNHKRDMGSYYQFLRPEDDYAYTPDEIVEHAWNEARLYDGPLKPLQGSVVPRFYGAFEAEEASGGRIFGIVLEFLGRPPRQRFIRDLHNRHK